MTMIRRRTGQNGWIAVILMLAGAVMMGIGIMRGELSTVFTKAVNICLECIGIG